ncbi:deoxynucleoside kinase, partial [Bacillus licheniformis]|uniref:deoxynucleoside kinase n=1 Tax=Bacillus licheniformis TaxID=1402 RepID=UPI002E1CDD0C|nr:deoxynucleoside kinase [Bacillus licheniformis]
KVDYKTYTSLFEAMVMTPYFPRPDVLVYLEGDLETILDRIQKRGREMELLTDRSYWEEMYTRYENWISGFNACPVVRVNIDEYDLFNNSASLDPIIEKKKKNKKK